MQLHICLILMHFYAMHIIAYLVAYSTRIFQMRVKCGQIKKKPNWEFFILHKNAYFVAYLTRIFSKIYPHILKIQLHKIAYPDYNISPGLNKNTE
jgi:hypothetical protein